MQVRRVEMGHRFRDPAWDGHQLCQDEALVEAIIRRRLSKAASGAA